MVAVDNVSFDLFEGETLGIVGESGSGKSVTSLSIMDLVSAPGEINHGSIQFRVDEQMRDLRSFSDKEMQTIRGRQIAMIFQEPMTALNPSFRCGPQVVEALRIHFPLSKIEARNRVLDLFGKVELPEPLRIFKAYPHELSGGQIQRVMIAMAISCKPHVLIADEPTTALDVTVQKSILKLLKSVQDEAGMSVIFISHDLGVIAEICDRVLVMRNGKVVESGRVEDVFKNAKHPYTKGLIACRPSLKKKYSRLPTVEDFLNGNKELNFETLSRQAEIKKIEKNRAEGVVLDVSNLYVEYPKTRSIFGSRKEVIRAVDNVSFQVYKGETLGLVGESGSGKSSIGKAILRLTDYGRGEVLFNGNKVHLASNREMRKLRSQMQIIFQDPYSSLNPRMKIGHCITEVLEVHSHGTSRAERKSRAVELLEQVGLSEEHFERYPHEFSGGQRQRISIARTLAVEPSFIICDECVSALDVSVQAQVLNLLKDLQERLDLSLIFISHDLSVVKHMSDRIIVLKDGRIVEEASSFDIYENPKMDYTRKLINAIPKGLY